jgi:hypothetical protein
VVAVFKAASLVAEALLAGELDLEGTDEGSFLATGVAEVLLEATARMGALAEMAALGLFSSAEGLAALLFMVLAVVLSGTLAAFFTAATGLDLLAAMAWAEVLAAVLSGVFAGNFAEGFAEDLAGDLAAALAEVEAAVLTELDLAAGIRFPQGHKKIGTHANPNTWPKHQVWLIHLKMQL